MSTDENKVAADLLEDNGFPEQAEILRTMVKHRILSGGTDYIMVPDRFLVRLGEVRHYFGKQQYIEFSLTLFPEPKDFPHPLFIPFETTTPE